jgi:hypothetical protein
MRCLYSFPCPVVSQVTISLIYFSHDVLDVRSKDY